jgi:hypothetical protein
VLGGVSVPLGTGTGSNGSVPEPGSVVPEDGGLFGAVVVPLGAWSVAPMLAPPRSLDGSATDPVSPNAPDCGDVVTIGTGNSPANRPEPAPPDAVDPLPGTGRPDGSSVVTLSGSAGGAWAAADGRSSRAMPRDI